MKAIWRRLLLVVPILFLWAGPALSQAQSCKEFQLQSYKNRYQSSEECWTREKRYKGATEYCCGIAFGKAAGELPQDDGGAGRSEVGSLPLRENPSGKLRTPPYVLSNDAKSRCASKGQKSSDAFQNCFADLMGRLVLTNEPEIAAQCVSRIAFEQPKCALEIYDQILLMRAASGDTSLAFDEDHIYWCSYSQDANVYSTGYYTLPGEGCTPEAKNKADQLEMLRRRLKYLRKLKNIAESEQRILELDYQIKEIDIALGRLMNQ